jgi:hypothetical protein
MCPSKKIQSETRGWVIAIGGGENKRKNPDILARFMK